MACSCSHPFHNNIGKKGTQWPDPIWILSNLFNWYWNPRHTCFALKEMSAQSVFCELTENKTEKKLAFLFYFKMPFFVLTLFLFHWEIVHLILYIVYKLLLPHTMLIQVHLLQLLPEQIHRTHKKVCNIASSSIGFLRPKNVKIMRAPLKMSKWLTPIEKWQLNFEMFIKI